MVFPTEYDSHRPRQESQLRKAGVPPPESVRISVCPSPPQVYGQLSQGELGSFHVSARGVGARVAGPQQGGHRFPGSGWAVVGERDERGTGSPGALRPQHPTRLAGHSAGHRAPHGLPVLQGGRVDQRSVADEQRRPRVGARSPMLRRHTTSPPGPPQPSRRRCHWHSQIRHKTTEFPTNSQIESIASLVVIRTDKVTSIPSLGARSDRRARPGHG